METMQLFYTQLFAVETSHNAYQTYLLKLTQLQCDQITALKSMLWWNGWGISGE